VARVGGRLAAQRPDLLNDGPGPTLLVVPVERPAEVVYENRGAVAGQLERLGPAESPAGAGHDSHLALQPNRHGETPSRLILKQVIVGSGWPDPTARAPSTAADEHRCPRADPRHPHPAGADGE